MGRTWLLTVSSKKLEACGNSSWKWIPPWSWSWGKIQRRCQRENRIRKEICEGTYWEHLCTRGSHTTMHAPPLPGDTDQSQVVISFLGSSSETWRMCLSVSSPSPCSNPSLGITASEVSISAKFETRQLKLEQEQVYSLQSPQPEERGFRKEARTTRRAVWTQSKGGEMEKFSGRWARI